MKPKIWAVLIVSIIVVAGVSAFILSGNKDDEKQRTYLGGVAGCLQVYGNANNDYTVDSKDKELISNLISNKTADWKKDYPFADANNDGVLDEADLEHVDKLINASAKKKAVAYVVCYATDREDGYVEDVMVPVTVGAFNVAATTIMALGTLGIVDEMCATTYSKTWRNSSDPLHYGKYEHLAVEEYCIGASTAKVDATLAANYVKLDDPLTCYVLSSGNTYDYYKVRDSVKELGISTIQIDDGSINPLKYASGILLLGYLFGTEKNNYAEKSHALADWMADFDSFMKSNIENLEAKAIQKKTCVVSTSANRVSSVKSSYSKDVEYYGMIYGIDENAGTAANMLMYNPSKGDNWLNTYDIDVPIVNTGRSSDTWKWYSSEKDPLKAPANLVESAETFRTLKNYDETIVICATMPAPFRAIFIMEIVYPELFDKGSVAIDLLEEYYFKFFGLSENCLDGIKLTYKPSELKAEPEK